MDTFKRPPWTEANFLMLLLGTSIRPSINIEVGFECILQLSGKQIAKVTYSNAKHDATNAVIVRFVGFHKTISHLHVRYVLVRNFKDKGVNGIITALIRYHLS